MRRRTLITASLGLGSLAGVAWTAAGRSEALAGLQLHSRSGPALGASVTVKVLHADAPVAQAAIDGAFAQLRTVDALMSLYRESSQVAVLNRLGVIEFPDPRLLHVLRVAQQLSGLSAGAFDITVQPLWQAFEHARSRGGLPSAGEREAARSLVGWNRLEVGAQRVRLRDPGMGITLNGLAQGYAVDLALAALRQHGIEHALLDTGEYASIGGKDHGQAWVLGIRHPRQPDALAARLKMDGRSVATSGDYETTFSADFAHHHIFDPASGDSPTTLASATVVAPSGILADGLSTAFLVMGAERSLRLAAQLEGVDTLLIGKDGRRWQSVGLAALLA